MAKLTCPDCGQEVFIGWAYCPFCGFPLREGGVKPPRVRSTGKEKVKERKTLEKKRKK
jgi:uncharacterized Zn finger protein (UPF0148 family)